jgi:hypothetical protein
VDTIVAWDLAFFFWIRCPWEVALMGPLAQVDCQGDEKGSLSRSVVSVAAVAPQVSSGSWQQVGLGRAKSRTALETVRWEIAVPKGAKSGVKSGGQARLKKQGLAPCRTFIFSQKLFLKVALLLGRIAPSSSACAHDVGGYEAHAQAWRSLYLARAWWSSRLRTTEEKSGGAGPFDARVLNPWPGLLAGMEGFVEELPCQLSLLNAPRLSQHKPGELVFQRPGRAWQRLSRRAASPGRSVCALLRTVVFGQVSCMMWAADVSRTRPLAACRSSAGCLKTRRHSLALCCGLRSKCVLGQVGRGEAKILSATTTAGQRRGGMQIWQTQCLLAALAATFLGLWLVVWHRHFVASCAA